MNKIHIFTILFLLLLSIFNKSFAEPISSNELNNDNTTFFSFTWTIKSITDWDTIYAYTWTNIDDSFKIRLLGFDTPEKYLFSIKDYKFYWCWLSASHFAEKNIIIWKEYSFYSDTLAKDEDDYWRKLRFLNLNNWDITWTWTYWYKILDEWLANFYKYENHSFTWIYESIDNDNKILHKWMYNEFCVNQDEYIKENFSRNWWWEIENIIDKTLKSKTNFHYQLQNANYDELKTLTWSIIFLEIDDALLTAEEIWNLKNNWNILIAYLSVWEAEPRRDYWDDSWIDDNWNITDLAPSWLWEKNPNWDSYKVRYWEDWWKNIVYKRIDDIKNNWYDWILLDVVDSYYYWQYEVDDKVIDADEQMVNFIWDIRNYLWDYLAIIPNWWLPLVEKEWYLDLINWILTESIFSENNTERSLDDKNWQSQYLDQVLNSWSWKIVMDIDYIDPSNSSLICDYYSFIDNKWYMWAIYELWLDSFEKYKCEINICTESNWTCSSSCSWIWQKIWVCQWWIVKTWSCSNSCWGWGWWYYRPPTIKKIFTIDNFNKNLYYLNTNNNYKIIQYKDSKYNTIMEKIWIIILNKDFYKYEKKILINELNDLWTFLYKYRENKLAKDEINNSKIELKKSIDKFIKDYNIAKKRQR